MSVLTEIKERIDNLEALTSLITERENNTSFKIGNAKIIRLDETDNYQIFLGKLEKGEVSEHTHAKSVEHFLILEGELEIGIEGKSKIYKIGDYCFVPIGAIHNCKAITASKFLIVLIPPELAFKGK